jgi:pyruvate/2-oxoacid:ferredoxin oxidoreductase alpha subunit
MKGNEAIVFGALMGGSTHYFGYPITPASEIAHAAATHYPKCGRHFLQAECEIASINMLYGATAAGARALTGTSGPGLSLMAEGLSYIAACELPAVVVDVQRVGPGLGNIWPEQSDYNCTVKGGGHGNYKAIILAPNSVQEMCDFAYQAFELAEQWRSLVIILTDACIGQMMEPVTLPAQVRHNPRKEWALYGDAASRANLITSIHMNPAIMSEHNHRLDRKYKDIAEKEVRCEHIMTGDADIVLVAFGICSRLAQTSVRQLRQQGIKAGLLRPITLSPFPSAQIAELAGKGAKFAVVELNNGQMVDDVRLAVNGKSTVALINWMGGLVPAAEEITQRVQSEFRP